MSAPHRMDGVIAATAAITIERLEIPAGVCLVGHGHDRPHLCHLVAGAFDERDGRKARNVLPGTLRRSPAGDEHDIRFRAPSRVLLVLVHGNPGDVAARLPSDRAFLDSERIRRLAGELWSALDAGEYASALELEIRTLELLAASMPPLGRRSPVPPAWLERVRDRIRDAPSDPPPTADLAGDEGYHPVYVARAFREYFGIGVGDFARLIRAEHARALLARSGEPIASVAARAGYADQSHLTRDMRRLLGTTPAGVRQRGGRAVHVSRVQDTGGGGG